MSTAETLRARWAALSGRERTGVTLATVVIAFGLVWAIAVQPAWRTLRTAPEAQAKLDAAWQRMQREAAEARRLRALPPVAPTLAAQSLQAATARLGAGARLSLQGERAVLTLNGVSGDALVQWLAEVRRGARARAVDAKLEAAETGYSGRITVALGSSA